MSSTAPSPDPNLSLALDLLARSERRCRDLERRQRRISAAIVLVLTLGLGATVAGLSGALAEDRPPVRDPEPTVVDLAARREALLSALPADKRKQVEEFSGQVQWLSEFMRASPDFDAGAAVALFLSMMARDVGAVPGMYQEMQVMNARMAAVPAMAAELQGINAKMSVMTSAMDSTMGRAGRMLPWMPFSP